MIIVGVGAGPDMLTLEAIREIGKAKLIYGSRRAIQLASRHICPESCVHIIEDYRKLQNLPEEAVVLSTGDPMLSGLGYLKGRIIPGISSMQITCARLKISQLRMVPISVHGRAMSPDSMARAASEIKSGRCIFLLTDDSSDLASLCAHLIEGGLIREVAVLSDLGYNQEKIEIGSVNAPPKIRSLSSVVIGDLSI